MALSELNKLAALVKQRRQDLLARWRQQVRQLPSARQLDAPTLNDHIPSLLDELAEALDAGTGQTIPESVGDDSAQIHGLQRVKDAFDIEEVVAEYNILRGGIHDLATENDINLQGRPFHVINRVFDRAIGLALKAYATQTALGVQQRREEYLAFVAHDLRTPLLAISLSGRILEETLPRQGYGAEAAKMLKSQRRSVQQLEALVRKVLEENEHVQTEAGVKPQRRQFDLWPLIEALIDEMRPLAKSAATRMLNEVPDDLVVFADAGLLKRVFQNLTSNAIHYTPGGVVAVGARRVGAHGVIECWVRDDGAGIPASLLGSVFEKGETDATNPDGTGLGLAIVKTFIEAHGGSITLESKEGVGSTFRFTLPVKATT